MDNLHDYGWAAEVAAEIAAERRPKTEAPTVVEVLKSELVKARIAAKGVTDPEKIAAIVARTIVTDHGQVIGLDAQGRPGVGSGDGFHLSIADLSREIESHSSSGTKIVESEKNPFARGPNYSITEQMIMLKKDPTRAEHLQYLASIGKN